MKKNVKPNNDIINNDMTLAACRHEMCASAPTSVSFHLISETLS